MQQADGEESNPTIELLAQKNPIMEVALVVNYDEDEQRSVHPQASLPSPAWTSYYTERKKPTFWGRLGLFLCRLGIHQFDDWLVLSDGHQGRWCSKCGKFNVKLPGQD